MLNAGPVSSNAADVNLHKHDIPTCIDRELIRQTVTMEQGKWAQMHETVGKKCDGWGLMVISAKPGA